MNRALFALLLVAVVAAGGCVSACAGEAEPKEPTGPGTGPLVRALRGAKDIVISPLEIPATVRRLADEREIFFAIWAGTLEGFGNGLVRFAAGCVELGTAPFPGIYLPLYNKRLGERAAPPARPPIGITRP